MSQFHSDWSHLHLSGWPFQTVPDESFTRVWADRVKVKQDVDRLIFRWSRVDRSTIHLMWADLGVGKTHTLSHIRQHCLRESRLGILPIYAVMPKQLRSFVEVYQAIVASLDLDSFGEMFASVYRSAGGKKAVVADLFPYIPDAAVALRLLQSDRESDRLLAAEWLRGTRALTRKHLNDLGMTRHVRTTDDVVAILSGLVRLVKLTRKYLRVVIMLDECQRIGRFKAAIGRDINTGLQTWYDSVPKHLTLLLSFGSGEERFVRHLLSQELQSREDHLRITLPLLSRDESVDFISDLLTHFRLGEPPSPWFPFNWHLVEAVICHLTRESGVTPRLLMKAFDSLLTEADYQIANGNKFDLSTTEAMKIVEHGLGGLDSES